MSNPLVNILVKALRDAGNHNGTPVPSYYSYLKQIEALESRAAKVHKIIQDALAEVPRDHT